MRITAVHLSFFLLAASIVPASAQELRGSVRGVVTDSSGGMVAGAKMSLQNVNTGVQVDRETNTGGQYLFDFVSPGTYRLTVSRDGFRSFVQENILVQTRSDVTIDARLEVGTVTETVRVIAAPVTVQFNKTTMETTLDTKMSNSLPIIHRNPFLLLALDPQVTFTSTSTEQSPFHHWAGSRLDVGGGTQLKNDILVDGSPNTWGPKTNYVPTMDSVSELNVQQNATDAEYGHSAGGIVSVQMKSGSNDWHGSAYYFGRNPKLNARPDSTTPTPSLIRHNVWGVTSGNPILKNRIFNFVSYEGQNLREPVNLIRTLPTALERQGDFSKTLFVNAGQTGMKPIYDPWTTRVDGGTVTRAPFAGNIIPKSQMDPVSLRFLQDIWAPNGPGDDATQVNNYRLTFPRVYEYWNFTDRVDWNLNDKWKVFGRFSRFHTNVTSPNPPGTPAASTGGSERNSLTLVGDTVWTATPTTVVSFRGSYGKPVDRFIDPVAEIKSLADFFPSNPTWFDSYAKALPVLYYPGLQLGGGFGRGSYWYSAPDFWNLQGKLSKQMGKHYLKIGGEFRSYRGNSSLPQPIQFFFPAGNTANTFVNANTRLSGHEWATFLLGAIGDNSRARNVPFLRGHNHFYGFYFQDDFKVSQNLTLNLGLRWEYDTPLVDPEQRLSRTLDLTSPIPEFQGVNAPRLADAAMAIRRQVPAYNGAWIHTDNAHPGAYNSPKNTWMPRLGIAWRLNDRTSLRFGYARYAIMPSVDFEGGINLNDVVPYPGFGQDSFPLPTVAGVPQARFRDPFPAAANPLVPPVGKSLGRYTELGSTAQSIIWNQNLNTAYNDRFNFSFQRQIWNQIVIDATYFMSYGFNERYQRQLNNIDPRYGYEYKTAVNARVNNPFYQILTPDQFPGGLRNIQQVSVNDLLRPFPHYNQVTEWFAEGIHRRYQAVQLKVQRPFANGFNFLAGYNYNRARNDEFFDGVDTFLDNLTLQDSSNAGHKFNVGGIYELPVGKGRRFAGGMNKFSDAVLGGWAVSGIWQYISGEYLRLPAALVSGNPRIDAPTRDRRFDTSKVVRNPDFTRRSNPLQWPGLVGPNIKSLDLTLGKEFRITERIAFELRMETYNTPNTFIGANPNLNPDSSLFGRVTSQRNTYYGRQFQYTGRIRW
ncbi:MAG: carboxypeptidase regulatory-like domain-containing protein [Acidobacteria bacterium]|nr:carboxypeptidase regulatory-like domain-containing protein [Acidobacteriota bacterium]